MLVDPAEALGRKGKKFTFVDIGANVGLYSLYLASCGDVRTLAIEPQPGILERLRFHLAANSAIDVDVLPIALSDRDGEAILVLNDSDRGGTHVDKRDGREAPGERIRVPCRPLMAVLAEAGIETIDALIAEADVAAQIPAAEFLDHGVRIGRRRNRHVGSKRRLRQQCGRTGGNEQLNATHGLRPFVR